MLLHRRESDLVLTGINIHPEGSDHKWPVPSSGVTASKCVLIVSPDHMGTGLGRTWTHSFSCVNTDWSWVTCEGPPTLLTFSDPTPFQNEQIYFYTSQFPSVD